MSNRRHPVADKKGKKEAKTAYPLAAETKHGLWVVFLFASALIFLLSFFNLAGTIGQGINYSLRFLFGQLAWLAPIVLLVISYYLLLSDKAWRFWHTIGLLFTTLGLIGLTHAILPPALWLKEAESLRGGGYIGYSLLWLLFKILGRGGSIVFLLALAAGGGLAFFETSPQRIFIQIKRLHSWLKARLPKPAHQANGVTPAPAVRTKEITLPPLGKLFKSRTVGTDSTKADLLPAAKLPLPAAKPELSLDLLDDRVSNPASGDIAAAQEKIRKTLANFGIEVEMGPVNVGPTVTQYTLAPAQGIKLSQITALANDLALALAAHPIRIEAPIPGQSLVGIEVPNQTIAIVNLKEILTSPEFKNRSSPLTAALGKDVAGRSWVIDIERMPHLLIAGATGSGKSVCINDIIISLLFTNSPDELRFIIIDPKRVELSAYNDIPHLWTPVITEIDKTINALKWVVGEMDNRYQLLSQAGKRNIQSYNQTADAKLPYIVVVIDELADLMAVAAQEVEAAVIRLAQMARAVGIHLIVATQRPSVDVITGLIKANITSRIAFAVASGIDSRTILDINGAEKLLGRGDCLYISAELSKPKRLQAAYVSDSEIERITSYLKQQAACNYNPDIEIKTSGKINGWGETEAESDELLNQAEDLVITSGKASATYLQRRLRIGYARAARLLDLLEKRGIVGPGQGAKPREILRRRELTDTSSLESRIETDSDSDEDSDKNSYNYS